MAVIFKDNLQNVYKNVYLKDERSFPIVAFLKLAERLPYQYVVTCLGRNEKFNEQVGGHEKSKHLTNEAVDISSRDLPNEAVSLLRDLASYCKLKFVDESATKTHFHIEVQNNTDYSFLRIKSASYVEAEDIVQLENSGALDLPLVTIHSSSFGNNFSQGIKIRLPVFRTGLTLLEIVARILVKYGYEIHVAVSPTKNNLLPLPLNLELMKLVNNASSSSNSKSLLKLQSIVKDNKRIYFYQFGDTNIIEVDDEDFLYYTDPYFIHFNTQRFHKITKKVSELKQALGSTDNTNIFFYKKASPDSAYQSYVDTIFVTNIKLDLENDQYLGQKIKPLSDDDEITLSFSPKVLRKDNENDVDFCTKICAAVGVSLVTAIKSIRVDLIDYSTIVYKQEPVVFVLPQLNKELFTNQPQRLEVGQSEPQVDIGLPITIDAISEVMEQYANMERTPEGKRKLKKIVLPVWNFSADIDLNSLGSGLVDFTYINQNINISRIFTLRSPFEDISNNNAERAEFTLKSNSPEARLLAEIFFKDPKKVEDLFNSCEFYKEIIQSNFNQVRKNPRDPSLPVLSPNATQWKITFTTIGIPFFQPGSCYDILNFLPNFLHSFMAFAPGDTRGQVKWRWRCIEVVHNFGVPYTMNVTLAVA